jgi:predicted DNA binding CopG/RHH family protein
MRSQIRFDWDVSNVRRVLEAARSLEMPTKAHKKRKIVIPQFESPNAEARWFDRNRARLEADISRRLITGDTTTLAGALLQSAAKEKAKLKPVTIRMLPCDLDAARRLAAEKGLPYQTYIKVLLREALRRETQK